ncbi:hypothetical protein GCM10009576_053500 [Streptomyces rhizosphaericus]|uniref:Thioesterase TesA-like domain-containing protein n=2 Tax=Streptomyces rhizosphaericus TaxID=114699 RepID=A0ABN1SEB8_9ACTN
MGGYGAADAGPGNVNETVPTAQFAEQVQAADAPHAGAAPDSLGALFRAACARGQSWDGMALLTVAARHRGQALSAMTSDMLRRAAEFASASPDRLTAMAYEPGTHCRAPNPPDWSLPHAEVVVDGDHFTMLEEHARTTALAIHRWLRAGPV